MVQNDCKVTLQIIWQVLQTTWFDCKTFHKCRVCLATKSSLQAPLWFMGKQLLQKVTQRE